MENIINLSVLTNKKRRERGEKSSHLPVPDQLERHF